MSPPIDTDAHSAIPEEGAKNGVRHLIDTQEYTRQELAEVVGLILLLKEADADGALPELLRRRTLGMIFEEPSTRTRVSFEVAMAKLGGHALYLKPGEIHLGRRESVSDTAKVLSRMCDVIEARTLKHETVLELAGASDVPVINGLTDFNHPTQALCDLFTMSEHLPPGRNLHNSSIVFVGDRTNVCSSTMFIATEFGMDFVHAAPPRYQAPPEWVAIAEQNAASSGGSVVLTDEVEAAVEAADFIYTDLWWWIDQEDEIPERRAAFMPRYQVNRELMARAPEHAKFMHCLPASRGVEVTDEVMDGPQSVVFEQAENRLHTEKAILTWLTCPTLEPPVAAPIRNDYENRIESYLARAGWEIGAAHRRSGER